MQIACSGAPLHPPDLPDLFDRERRIQIALAAPDVCTKPRCVRGPALSTGWRTGLRDVRGIAGYRPASRVYGALSSTPRRPGGMVRYRSIVSRRVVSGGLGGVVR